MDYSNVTIAKLALICHKEIIEVNTHSLINLQKVFVLLATYQISDYLRISRFLVPKSERI